MRSGRGTGSIRMAMRACCFADSTEGTRLSSAPTTVGILKETRRTRRVKFQEEAPRELSAEVISSRFGRYGQDRMTTGIPHTLLSPACQRLARLPGGDQSRRATVADQRALIRNEAERHVQSKRHVLIR